MDPAVQVPATKRQRKRDLRRQISVAVAPETSVRRSTCEVKKFDLWSVLKVALCFYLAALAVLVVAVVVLWIIADSAGVIDNIENFFGDLLSSKNFHFVSAQILEGVVLVGLVLVALLTIVTVVAAAFYNVFSEIVGGIEITLVESEPGR